MAKRKRPRGPKQGTRSKASDSARTEDERVDSAHLDESDTPVPESPQWARWKTVVSLLLVFHLLAVILPPLAFQTFSAEGPSPLVGSLIRPFAGYGQFLHMDRGYAFFAPDPGPSHLIEAAFVQPDGTIQEAMYPDLEKQWPRLLYHRHFMLSEYLNEIYFPQGPPEELFEEDPEAAEAWQQRRARYEFVRQSMVDHLKDQNAGREVAVRRIEHLLPALPEYQREPIELTDDRLYQVLLDQPVFLDDELPPAGAPGSTEEIPAPVVEGDLPPRADSPNGSEASGQTQESEPGTAEQASDAQAEQAEQEATK